MKWNKNRFILLALVWIMVLPTGALAASKGYAVYRDKNFDLSTAAGHTGIVDVVNASGAPTYVIHMAGNSGLQRVTLANFKVSGSQYYGAFYKPGVLQWVYNEIQNKAYIMYANYSFFYVVNTQLALKWSTSIITTKIEPIDILSTRCDGLVEYCFEYYDIQLLGPTTHWNISNPTHFNSHNGIYTPAQQRAKLTLSS